MIVVRYEKDGGHFLSTEGHATSEVCAAVSILIMTLSEVIQEEVVSNDYGYSEISCPFCENNDSAFDFTLQGLEILAEHNPDQLKME